MVRTKRIALHDLEDIRLLVAADAWELATRTSRGNARCLGLIRGDVAKMLAALMTQDHRKVFGPVDSDYGTIDADDYKLWYDEEQTGRGHPNQALCYYIKLGIHTTTEGDCCLVVSFHLDSRP